MGTACTAQAGTGCSVMLLERIGIRNRCNLLLKQLLYMTFPWDVAIWMWGVCAGYDAHWHDPLAGFQYQSKTYHMLCQAMVELSKELCNGRCLFILEGGYDQASLAEAVTDSISGILGGPILDTFDPASLQKEPLDKVQDVLTQSREAWLRHLK